MYLIFFQIKFSFLQKTCMTGLASLWIFKSLLLSMVADSDSSVLKILAVKVLLLFL